MEDNKNLIYAILMSVAVMFAWQVFYAGPKMEQERILREQKAQAEKLAEQQAAATQQAQPVPQAQAGQGVNTPSVNNTPSPAPAAPAGISPGPGPALIQSRQSALAQSPRVAIDSPSLTGSIALKGGRIDDVVLRKFNITIDANSGNVVLFSPSGSQQPYFAQFNWVPAAGSSAKVPNDATLWTEASKGALSSTNPVVLTYDNGEGLVFRRTFALDEHYMFTVTDEVQNQSGKPAALHAYGQIARLYKPTVEGFFVLHEGPVGVFGEKGLVELGYDDAKENSPSAWTNTTGGWLGITDKYWAAALVPDQTQPFQVNIYGTAQNHYFANYLKPEVTIAAGETKTVTNRLFAGAKRVELVDGYAEAYAIKNFDLLIDWGWFYFITKPMFFVLDYFYKLVGNFGVSILIVTVLIKLLFFPFANKSYESMGKLKKLQPELMKIKERHKDDRMKQQQAMMALYKKEKVNPMAGCLPLLAQIPVFFALYKVLFVTIEMRHAPFIGWIQDLSAPDPTSIFNLFGLMPWDVPHILLIGVWPLLMGFTMFVQMKMNPMPTDPIQQKIFTYMPVLFTFMLAQFPAGLVIYWTWNNLLTILQQGVIMRRQGVKIELWDNLGFGKSAAGAASTPRGGNNGNSNGRSRKPAE